MLFRDRIKELRELNRLTQKQLATELNNFQPKDNSTNIYTQTVSYWENGREPNIDTLIKLSKYFNVSIDYLLGNSSIKEVFTEGYFSESELKILSKNAGSIEMSSIERNFSAFVNKLKTTYISMVTDLDYPDYFLISDFQRTISFSDGYFNSILISIKLISDLMKNELRNLNINSFSEFKYQIIRMSSTSKMKTLLQDLAYPDVLIRLIEQINTSRVDNNERAIKFILYCLVTSKDDEFKDIYEFIKLYLLDTAYAIEDDDNDVDIDD